MLPLVALSFLFQSQALDIVICHAHVVDGSGNPWFQGDTGIRVTP
jgi:N-acyl-D-aspartate/D-glutamate deacylase